MPPAPTARCRREPRRADAGDVDLHFGALANAGHLGNNHVVEVDGTPDGGACPGVGCGKEQQIANEPRHALTVSHQTRAIAPSTQTRDNLAEDLCVQIVGVQIVGICLSFAELRRFGTGLS